MSYISITKWCLKTSHRYLIKYSTIRQTKFAEVHSYLLLHNFLSQKYNKLYQTVVIARKKQILISISRIFSIKWKDRGHDYLEVPSVLASLVPPLSNQKSCPKCFVMIPRHITVQPADKYTVEF